MAAKPSTKAEAWVLFDYIVAQAAPGGEHTNPWALTPDRELHFEPDYDTLRRLLGVPLHLKAGTQSGVPALALDVWLSYEFRRAGFRDDQVWPRPTNPLGRLYEVAGASGTRRFLYDGDDLVAEYDNGSPGTLLRRFVHGTSAGDDPLVWFEGSGVADSSRYYFYADERGSIMALTDSSGNVTNAYTYDEYGIPGSGNAGTFQYTGQVWLPELGMYYYKSRMYSPTLGRFMQTDPIGYGDGMNMYAYVHSDPVNGVDPSGLDDNEIWVRTCAIASQAPECQLPLTPASAAEIMCAAYGNCYSMTECAWLFDVCRDNSALDPFALAAVEEGAAGSPQSGPCKNKDWSTADSALYVLDFVGTAADVTSVLAEFGAAQSGELTPPALFLHGVAAGANGLSRLTSVGSLAIHVGQRDWSGAAGDVVGALSAHTVGKLAGKALKGAMHAEAGKGAAEGVAGKVSSSGFGGC